MRLANGNSLRRVRAWVVFSSVMLVLPATGCGRPKSDYSKVDLVRVGGKVTMEGSPLAGVTVVFEDPAGTFSFGKTDEEGRYDLQFDSVKKGISPGRKTVRITSRPVGEESEGEGEGGEAGVREKEKIPRKYNAESTLAVEVSASDRQHDFDLTPQ